MATTVIQAFNEFLRDKVNLDPDKTTKGRNSRDWLVGQIQHFEDDDKDFPEIYTEKNIYFGSFARRTKKRPLDDIDIMICLKANGCTYLEYSDRIELTVPETATRFLKYRNDGTTILNSRKLINKFVAKLADIPQYEKAVIKGNLEAATLNLTSYDWVFDIVPCFFTTEDQFGRTYYIIPDGKGNWKKTDPRIDKERLTNLNTNHDGNILNVIRTIKYWNNRATMQTMRPYLLENMIIEYYQTKTTKASQFVDIELVDVFLDIHNRVYNNINDPKGIQGNINQLTLDEKRKISQIAYDDYVIAFNARKLEEQKNMKGSINKWREIFGDEFPKYTE
jgi:hypothetical protein